MNLRVKYGVEIVWISFWHRQENDQNKNMCLLPVSYLAVQYLLTIALCHLFLFLIDIHNNNEKYFSY